MPNPKKIGIGLDYNNICTDYNTVYLDRDNDDPKTVACMKKVLRWLDAFLSEMIEEFEYSIYRRNHKPALKLSEIVSKRFLFYSLEKELTAQTFILEKANIHYNDLAEWEADSKESILIQNDEAGEGEGIYFYVTENSKIHAWLLDKLKDLSLDEIPFSEA